jgi:bacillithiol system protein YtxJ
MNEWKAISATDELQSILEESDRYPVVIFKHSTRCSLSTIAKMRLADISNLSITIPLFLINVIESRMLSNAIADLFDVHHESPQVLLIHQRDCIFESSHLDITSDELMSQIPGL